MKRCRLCFSEITPEMLKKRKHLKSERIKEAIEERRRNGEPVGAPRKYTDEQVISLRNKGLSYRKIAKELGCSTSIVTRALGSSK